MIPLFFSNSLIDPMMFLFILISKDPFVPIYVGKVPDTELSIVSTPLIIVDRYNKMIKDSSWIYFTLKTMNNTTRIY